VGEETPRTTAGQRTMAVRRHADSDKRRRLPDPIVTRGGGGDTTDNCRAEDHNSRPHAGREKRGGGGDGDHGSRPHAATGKTGGSGRVRKARGDGKLRQGETNP
jgi:hypothetical protein